MYKRPVITLILSIGLLFIHSIPTGAGIARMLGMGGVYLGVMEDSSAAYFSPASLAFLETTNLSLSVGPETIEIYPALPFMSTTSIMVCYSAPDIGNGAYGVYYITQDYRLSPDRQRVTTNHNVIGYSFSRALSPNFSYGLGARVDQYDGGGGSNLNFDVAALIRPVSPIYISFLVRNFNNNNRDPLPRDISAGIAFKPTKGVTLAWQMDSIEYQSESSLVSSTFLDKCNIGAELILGGIAMRVGMFRRMFCYGAGLSFGRPGQTKVTFDLAYGTYDDGLGNVNSQAALETVIQF